MKSSHVRKLRGHRRFGLDRFEFQRGFGSRTDMEFVVNVSQVPPDGSIGQAGAGGDFFIGEATRQQLQDLPFATGKPFHLDGRGQRFLERGNDLPGNFPRHGCSSLADFADGGNQFLKSAALEQVARGAGPQCFEDPLSILVDGHDDDLDGREQLL